MYIYIYVYIDIWLLLLQTLPNIKAKPVTQRGRDSQESNYRSRRGLRPNIFIYTCTYLCILSHLPISTNCPSAR